MAGTNFNIKTSNPNYSVMLTDADGFALMGVSDISPPPTDAGVFQHGCIMFTPADTYLPPFMNVGTVGGAFWVRFDAISHPVAAPADTNGTTPVAPLFGGPALFSFGIVSAYIISLDATPADILIKNNGALVSTITKSTTPGVMTGGTSYLSTHVNIGDTMTIESTSTGNATVYVWINPLA